MHYTNSTILDISFVDFDISNCHFCLQMTRNVLIYRQTSNTQCEHPKEQCQSFCMGDRRVFLGCVHLKNTHNLGYLHTERGMNTLCLGRYKPLKKVDFFNGVVVIKSVSRIEMERVV